MNENNNQNPKANTENPFVDSEGIKPTEPEAVEAATADKLIGSRKPTANESTPSESAVGKSVPRKSASGKSASDQSASNKRASGKSASGKSEDAEPMRGYTTKRPKPKAPYSIGLKHELNKRYGAVVRRERIKRGLTQIELADMLGTTRQTLIAIELGRRELTLSKIAKISYVLGVDTLTQFGIDLKHDKDRGLFPYW